MEEIPKKLQKESEGLKLSHFRVITHDEQLELKKVIEEVFEKIKINF